MTPLRSLAIEYAPSGIRVNAISPGIVKTPMHRLENYESLGQLHPMGRVGAVDDVVRGVMYPESAPVRDRGVPARRRRPDRRPLSAVG